MEPKIKVSKHMPDVFLQSRNALPKDREKKHTQKISQSDKGVQQQKQQNQQNKKKQEKEGGRSKKNRNPFFNVREYLRLSKQMDDKMNQVRQELDRDRFSQFNLQNNSEVSTHKEEVKQFKQHKIKYEDCLTLNLIKKTQTSSLRKILHVPSLKVYYLRQSRIDFSIDKTDLQQWVRRCNAPSSSPILPQKIIQLYWNIPQGYYSIVYQYTDGVLLDIILQNTNIPVLQFVQNLALTHLKSDIQIFNSILIVRKNSQSDIKYLPVYEEIDDMLPQYRMFRELLKINYFEENSDVKKIEKNMVGRLGFLMLVTIFSGALVDQDISNILFQSKDCCLFHQQMSNASSLLRIYFDQNILYGSEKQVISDFLCKMLKFKPEERASFSELSKHKFFKTKFSSEFNRMNEIIKVLQMPGSSTSKSPSRDLANNKLKKIINSMSLILQGASEKDKKQVDLSPTNPNIRYILSELGFSFNEIQNKLHSNQVINMLKKAYDL